MLTAVFAFTTFFLSQSMRILLHVALQLGREVQLACPPQGLVLLQPLAQRAPGEVAQTGRSLVEGLLQHDRTGHIADGVHPLLLLLVQHAVGHAQVVLDHLHHGVEPRHDVLDAVLGVQLKLAE